LRNFVRERRITRLAAEHGVAPALFTDHYRTTPVQLRSQLPATTTHVGLLVSERWTVDLCTLRSTVQPELRIPAELISELLRRLHTELRIAHTDLLDQNILLRPSSNQSAAFKWEVCFTDFGNSFLLDEQPAFPTTEIRRYLTYLFEAYPASRLDACEQLAPLLALYRSGRWPELCALFAAEPWQFDNFAFA
jgi:serine/threonine protein kinase